MRKLEKWLCTNDYNYYVILTKKGKLELYHSSGLSSILECGDDMGKYGIAFMWQCGDSKKDAERTAYCIRVVKNNVDLKKSTEKQIEEFISGINL